MSWLKRLTESGYEVCHSESTYPSYSERKKFTLKIDVKKDGKIVSSVTNKGEAIEKTYKIAAEELGLVTDAHRFPSWPVELTIEKSDRDADIYKHPSFGVIRFSRYTGGSKHFMSPVDTHGGITMEIHTADLHHSDLGSDSVFARKLLISVDMSFTQFAEAITSLNHFDTPVTIRYFDGCKTEQIEMKTQQERILAQTERTMYEAVKGYRQLINELDKEMSGAGALSAPRKKEIWQKIKFLEKDLDSHPIFMLTQIKKFIDNSMCHAKHEFINWASSIPNVGEHIRGLPGSVIVGDTPQLENKNEE